MQDYLLIDESIDYHRPPPSNSGDWQHKAHELRLRRERLIEQRLGAREARQHNVHLTDLFRVRLRARQGHAQ